jgi:hypothetical protein
LDPKTNVDDFMTFLRENEIEEKNCEELQTRDRNKVFKIGVPYGLQ